MLDEGQFTVDGLYVPFGRVIESQKVCFLSALTHTPREILAGATVGCQTFDIPAGEQGIGDGAATVLVDGQEEAVHQSEIHHWVFLFDRGFWAKKKPRRESRRMGAIYKGHLPIRHTSGRTRQMRARPRWKLWILRTISQSVGVSSRRRVFEWVRDNVVANISDLLRMALGQKMY